MQSDHESQAQVTTRWLTPPLPERNEAGTRKPESRSSGLWVERPQGVA